MLPQNIIHRRTSTIIYLQANCNINKWYCDKQDLPGDNGEYYKNRICINERQNREVKVEWDVKIYDAQVRRHQHIMQCKNNVIDFVYHASIDLCNFHLNNFI